MRLDINRRDTEILIDALSQPAGVTQVDRRRAEELRGKLQAQLGQNGSPLQPNRMPIRCAWPSTDMLRSKPKPNQFYHKPRQPKPRLGSKNEQDKPTLTVDNILKGLL